MLCGWPWLQPLRCAGGVWCSQEVEELPPVREDVLPHCVAFHLLGSQAMRSDWFKQWSASMCFKPTAGCCFPSVPFHAGGRPGSAAWLGHLGGPAARAAVGHRCQAQGGPVSGWQRVCLSCHIFLEPNACPEATPTRIATMHRSSPPRPLPARPTLPNLQAQAGGRSVTTGRQAAVRGDQREVGQVSMITSFL